MQLVALKKQLVQTQKKTYIYITSGNLGVSNFPRNWWKKKLRKINHLVQKHICWLRPWRKKSRQLLWGRPSFDIRTNQANFNFWLVSPIRFSLHGKNLVVLENKRFDYVKKSKTFALSRFFSVLEVFDARNVSQNIVIERCCTMAELMIKTLMWEIPPVVLDYGYALIGASSLSN